MRHVLAACLLATTALAACGEADMPDDGAPAGSTEIEWAKTPVEHRGKNGQQFLYWCPPGGDLGARGVWGTDVYTDDSSICVAGVHAGKITAAKGGLVKIEIRPGQDSYVASTRNGVTSTDYDHWDGSFVCVQP